MRTLKRCRFQTYQGLVSLTLKSFFQFSGASFQNPVFSSQFSGASFQEPDRNLVEAIGLNPAYSQFAFGFLRGPQMVFSPEVALGHPLILLCFGSFYAGPENCDGGMHVEMTAR